MHANGRAHMHIFIHMHMYIRIKCVYTGVAYICNQTQISICIWNLSAFLAFNVYYYILILGIFKKIIYLTILAQNKLLLYIICPRIEQHMYCKITRTII